LCNKSDITTPNLNLELYLYRSQYRSQILQSRYCRHSYRTQGSIQNSGLHAVFLFRVTVNYVLRKKNYAQWHMPVSVSVKISPVTVDYNNFRLNWLTSEILCLFTALSSLMSVSTPNATTFIRFRDIITFWKKCILKCTI
jgi:hypothetical protein